MPNHDSEASWRPLTVGLLTARCGPYTNTDGELAAAAWVLRRGPTGAVEEELKLHNATMSSKSHADPGNPSIGHRHCITRQILTMPILIFRTVRTEGLPAYDSRMGPGSMAMNVVQ
jgi:hypothetical protein